MKIVVIGGSGLIGTKLVKKLRDAGHEVVAASLSSGVNILTGEGLDAALAVRATQFFEFLGAIANASTEGNTVRLSSGLMQPLAADDVASALADVAAQPPLNGTIDVEGPEALGIDELVRRFFRAKGDPRQVQGDAEARYFGAKVHDRSLRSDARPRIGPTRFEEWLRQASPR